jgi:hypothetical protein
MIAQLSTALVAAACLTLPSAAQCTLASGPYGSGCGGFTPFGIPVVTCSGAPTIGNPGFGFTTTAPCFPAPTSAVILVGTCRTTPIVFASGYGAGGLCGPSMAVCAQYLDIVTWFLGTPQAGGFAFATPVPNVPQLVGLQLCVQGAHVCPGVPCLAVTNAMRVTLQ